ncbi:MAG: extracellular solute-binding protein [Elusimicrobia bacterium]|nr:extracellular solute-binding protein [Elusimicrobiota bacterium]
MFKKLLVVISGFLLILIFICSCSKSAIKLRVFAAAGAKPAIDECSRMFEEKSGIKIEIDYGGGGEILSKMMIAESGDIYIAPEQRFMTSAKNKGVVEPETIRVLSYMIPVIAVKKGNPKNIHTLVDLTKSGIRVVITRPETTLLGKYAPEIFRKAGIKNAIKKNIITYAARPDAIIMMLSTEHVDAGIIWHFYQTMAPDKIETIFLSAEQLTGIGEMQIAASKYSRNKKLARRFVDFAASSAGKTIFKKHGYIVDTADLKKYWQ